MGERDRSLSGRGGGASVIRFTRVAFWSLAIFTFAIPWERSIAVPFFGAAGTPFGGIALLLGVVSLVGSGRIRLRTPSAALVLITLFVFWSSLTYFWSLNPSATVDRTMTYAQLLVMAWLVWQLTRTPRDTRALMQAYVFGCHFAILVVLLDFVTGNALIVSPSTGLARFSFAGNDPNYFALTLVLALPMAWYLTLRSENRLLNAVNLLYLPLAVIVIGLTGSRGGVVSTLIALTIIPATFWRLSIWRKFLLTVVIAVTAIGALSIIPDLTFQRIAETPQDIAEADLTGRVDIWRSGFRFLRDNEWAVVVGAGSGNYPTAVASYLGRARTAHNAYLNVLVENGIVGLSLFLALFAVALLPNLGGDRTFRSVAFVMTLSLAVGIVALSWEREKPLWFALALLTTHRTLVLSPTSLHPSSRGTRPLAPPGSAPGGRSRQVRPD